MKKATIFIVEDDLISAQYLWEILEEEGFELLGRTDNGPEALKQLDETCADIVLMDIILKGAMSGSETALRLRQKHPRCRIIFLTAYADEEMIEYALDARAIAYLMKPYREKEIIATIRMALKQRREPRETPSMTHLPLKAGFTWNTETDMLEHDSMPVLLSDKKRQLIALLIRHRNSIVSNEQISLHIWGDDTGTSRLRSLISRIKEQLGADLITNANGLGYMITTER